MRSPAIYLAAAKSSVRILPIAAVSNGEGKHQAEKSRN